VSEPARKVFTRRDLRTYDNEAWSLVKRMQEHGWTGRLSGNGHVVMYAPDGVHSQTFSRDSLRGRSGRNARAMFERWLRQREGVEEGADG